MSLVENKKARLEYEILDEYEAGIALVGHEVKAVRGGKASLEGARVVVRGGEAFLIGAAIQPYQPGNTPALYDPERSRRLLITKKEIAALADAEHRGLTIVPLKWYNKNRKLKVALVTARKKKKYDKRATLKERDIKREISRSLKREY